MIKKQTEPRREFLGKLTASAAAVAGFSTLSTSFAFAEATWSPADLNNAEEIFKKITGKRRVVFDATRPHDLMPFAWPRVFLITNEKTGTLPKDCSVMVVLRHDAIPYAFQSSMWEKYNFGEVFKANDPVTNAPSKRNPFWDTKPGDFKVPGLGVVAIGINELQASGVLFCVCDAAMTVYSAAIADGMKLDAAAVKKEWQDNLLPNIQPVPSGVWALGRAQEKNCAYIFAG